MQNPKILSAEDIVANQLKEKEQLLNYISQNIYGNDEYIDGPFGPHKQVYCDYAASGKPLKFIEEYMNKEVLPIYANTHTTSSFTGIQMSCFREEAREIIRDTYHCSNDDIILFCGNGSTGAINAFARILGIQKAGVPFKSEDKPYKCEFPACKLCFNDVGDLRLHQRTHTDGDAGFHAINVDNSEGRVVHHNFPVDSPNPIVFIGPYEHHSNMLVWRESQADVVVIPEYDTEEGGLNIEFLEQMLQKYQDRKLKICSFSLCSNVTGILTDPDVVNVLAHKYNALICWDCASACGHLPISMNSTYLNHDNYVDALFFSPHKMVGGPGCPGVLILKKWYFTNDVPNEIGGGTIHYVGLDRHRFTYILTDKEEGGTPNVLGDIKLGLNTLGWEYIAQREKQMVDETIQLWSQNPNIEILGKTHQRSAIISILIKHNNFYLHWNFVSMLLSDIFGIQCRSGCMCAGPYSMSLLGINRENSLQLDHLLLNKNEIIRPGYTRISLSYALSDAELHYIQQAVLYVATYGFIFLPEYIYFSETAEWKHVSIRNKKPYRRWLNKVSYKSGKMTYPHQDERLKVEDSLLQDSSSLYAEYLENAMKLAKETYKKIVDDHYTIAAIYTSDNTGQSVDEDIDKMRWYITRYEIYNELKDMNSTKKPVETVFSEIEQQLQQATRQDIENQDMLIQIHHSKDKQSHDIDLNNEDDDQTYEEMVQDLKEKNSHPTAQPAPSQKSAKSKEEKENVFLVKSDKLKKPLPKCFSATGREIVPVNIAKLRGEEGVEFRYIDGPDGMSCGRMSRTLGSVEYTAFVRGMTFEERCKYMRTHKDLYPQPSKKIMRLVGQANGHFNMIKEGDRVMLGLSGGKDSLTMLHCLLQLQKRSPYKFDLACVTVDPQTNGFDPSPLRAYCHKIGVPYYYESRSIVQLAATKMQNNSLCSFCSRMKRGVLYSTMRREGYNVLVLAQHLDDLCESFLMSLFHNGLLRTMKANYTVAKGDIRVVRPFIYLREKDTREFAKGCELPIIDENCPACFEGYIDMDPKERYRMKQLLASQENLYSNIYNSILSAMMPLLSVNTASMSLNNQVHETPRRLRGKRYREEDEKNSKKKNLSSVDIEDDDDDDIEL